MYSEREKAMITGLCKNNMNDINSNAKSNNIYSKK